MVSSVNTNRCEAAMCLHGRPSGSGRPVLLVEARVSAAAIDERRTPPVGVVQYVPDEDDVIAAVVARLVAALELRGGVRNERDAELAGRRAYPLELVRDRLREAVR